MRFCQLKIQSRHVGKASFERPAKFRCSLPANQQRDFLDRAQTIELPMKRTRLRAENNFLPAVREI
jgi:hypothetical protein